MSGRIKGTIKILISIETEGICSSRRGFNIFNDINDVGRGVFYVLLETRL